MVTKLDNWHCSNEKFCPGGDCPGCKNGKRNCKDPRCAPFCYNCNPHKDRDRIVNMIMLTILIAMIAIFLFVTFWLLYPTRYVYVPNRLTVDPPYGSERAQILEY